MAQISVIVPVYNVEPYLHRCVDSILSQSFPDFQLILVDDGSPDNCGEICDCYAAKDSRVHVIHQKNAGLSAARNAAIDWTFGNTDCQWLTFIDSDDWVHPEYLQRLLDGALQYNAKVSICGYAETEGEDPLVPPETLEAQCREPAEFYRNNNVSATIACAKLYARECFQQVRFPLGKVHEDEFVTYRMLFLRPQIVFIPAPLYAYYVNLSGLTKKAWSARHLDAWEAYEQQIDFFTERQEEDMIHFRYREYIQNSYAQLLAAQAASNASQLKKEIAGIKKHMRKLLCRAWKRGYIRFWIDFDMLYACNPIGTKLYRLWIEITNR